MTQPIEGVDAAEWTGLVARGRATGLVSADEVAHVMRHVELTSEALTAATQAPICSQPPAAKLVPIAILSSTAFTLPPRGQC